MAVLLLKAPGGGGKLNTVQRFVSVCFFFLFFVDRFVFGVLASLVLGLFCGKFMFFTSKGHARARTRVPCARHLTTAVVAAIFAAVSDIGRPAGGPTSCVRLEPLQQRKRKRRAHLDRLGFLFLFF